MYVIIDNDQRNVFLDMTEEQVKEYVEDVLSDFGPEETKNILVILDQRENLTDQFITNEVN